MTKTARKIKDRVEIRTGMIWGLYELPESFMGLGRGAQPLFHLMIHGRNEGLVRIEGGFRRKGFYLSWGER
jgi:hypothetical protein